MLVQLLAGAVFPQGRIKHKVGGSPSQLGISGRARDKASQVKHVKIFLSGVRIKCVVLLAHSL